MKKIYCSSIVIVPWHPWPLMVALLLLLGGASTAETDEAFPVEAEVPTEAQVRMSLSGGTVITMPELLPQRARTVDASAERMMAIYQAIDAQDWSSAIHTLRPILQEEPDNMGAHTAAVFVLDKLNRHREAIELLEKMLIRFPEDYRTLNNLAWIYATADEKELRDVVRAIDLVRDALLRAPGDYRIWSTLAECHYISGDFDRAVTAMMKTIEMATGANAAHQDLLNYRERLMRFRQAAAVFQLRS